MPLLDQDDPIFPPLPTIGSGGRIEKIEDLGKFESARGVWERINLRIMVMEMRQNDA